MIGNGGEYDHARAITPNDNADLAKVTRAISCTGAGNVVVILENDTTAVTLSVAVGHPLRVRAKRVLATSTTATGLVALY